MTTAKINPWALQDVVDDLTANLREGHRICLELTVMRVQLRKVPIWRPFKYVEAQRKLAATYWLQKRVIRYLGASLTFESKIVRDGLAGMNGHKLQSLALQARLDWLEAELEAFLYRRMTE